VLLALLLFGGESIRYFVLALFIGIAYGHPYSLGECVVSEVSRIMQLPKKDIAYRIAELRLSRPASTETCRVCDLTTRSGQLLALLIDKISSLSFHNRTSIEDHVGEFISTAG
jgi:hypothetical protein